MADIYEFLIPRTEKILESLSDSGPIENALELTKRVITTLLNGEKVIRGKITEAKIIFGGRIFTSYPAPQKQHLCHSIPNRKLIVLIDEELKITAE